VYQTGFRRLLSGEPPAAAGRIPAEKKRVHAMAITLHAETVYSYRRSHRVITGEAATGDARTLARIEQLLVAAADAYRSRRYLDGVRHYTEARQLVWSQLFPSSRFDEVQIRDLDIHRTLASYAGEWMNVLPVESAPAGVRPRELAAVDTGKVVGLHAAAVDTVVAGAAADLAAAKTLEHRGNVEAAKFFRQRATEVAPTFVNAAAVRVSEGDGGVTGLTARRFTDLAAIELTELEIPASLTVAKRSYAVEVGDRVRSVSWTAGAAPKVDDLLSTVFEPRKVLQRLPDILIAPQRPADVAAGLPHVWYYETPLGLAECHHALGDWQTAERWYLQAAGYRYLNATAEAPYLWARLATLYLDWGNSLFRSGDPQAALAVYGKVVAADGSVPGSALHTTPALTPAATVAATVIGALDDPSALDVSPAIAAAILDVWAQIAKISGGLDFWGHWAANVPIWTFDYLQSVAANFCQLAVSAERDAISFWEKADQGELTRLQLQQNVTLARAERQAAQAQVAAADAQVEAYRAGEEAAKQRARHARENADEYATRSRQWTMHQALSAQLSGGEDGNAAQLNRYADRMVSGSYSLRGDRGTLAAAEQLAGARLQREYEIHAMRRQQADLEAATVQAREEREAAQARATAARASAHAAAVRVNGALELVAAYDQQRFTPDVWNALGERMGALSQRYLVMALDVAKLMQRAYNFEQDTDRALIKGDYASDAVKGLLAADSLLADVHSFTYDMVTTNKPVPQPVRQTISLAGRYPFLFERDLRTTGRMEFETRIDDFDVVYPGTYGGRIEHVEVEVDGIVPARGVSGTLTNAGISHYRVPSAAWTTGNGLKHRVQNRETLVLSDHDPRADAILTGTDRRRRRVFEGAGVASSWTLDLPPAVNDLDYDAVTDVRLTFTYEARYDAALRDRVLADLAALPSLNERQRPVPIRWLFPDAFFSFYETGVLELDLEPEWFPRSERDPKLQSLGLFVVTTPRARRGGITLAVKAPGTATQSVTTAADGTVDAADLANIDGKPATGTYRIELAAADNPDWVTNGALDLDAVDNIALIVGYSFTPRA
jgi:hypothetical protein